MIQDSAAHAALGGWEDFYLIVGSAAAALTGLQFVVITLVTEGRTRTPATLRGIDTFSTPTIVHFCVALLVSVAMCAPWPSLFPVAVVLGAAGIVGLVYTAIVVARARGQTVYELVAEDWIWHIALPAVVYATYLVASALLTGRTLVPLFAIAAATLLLVYIGIHNAWDTSTYMVAQRIEASGDSATTREPAPAAASSPASGVAEPAPDRAPAVADARR